MELKNLRVAKTNDGLAIIAERVFVSIKEAVLIVLIRLLSFYQLTKTIYSTKLQITITTILNAFILE